MQGRIIDSGIRDSLVEQMSIRGETMADVEALEVENMDNPRSAFWMWTPRTVYFLVQWDHYSMAGWAPRNPESTTPVAQG